MKIELKPINLKTFITKADLKRWEKKVSVGEISYAVMIKLLNEKAHMWHVASR